jgi:hypothetical protein
MGRYDFKCDQSRSQEKLLSRFATIILGMVLLIANIAMARAAPQMPEYLVGAWCQDKDGVFWREGGHDGRQPAQPPEGPCLEIKLNEFGWDGDAKCKPTDVRISEQVLHQSRGSRMTVKVKARCVTHDTGPQGLVEVWTFEQYRDLMEVKVVY